MKQAWLVYLMLFVAASGAIAQVPDTEPGPSTDVIENLVEDQEDNEFAFDTFLENLEFLQANPLTINKADYDDLRQTGLFTELQIRQLLNHIQHFGSLTSILELQTIPSFSVQDIQNISSYISVNNTISSTAPWRTRLTKGRSALYMRSTRVLEEQAGYNESDPVTHPYAGDAWRLYARYNYNYKNEIRYGFTVEKDPGESLQNGIDYYSAHYFQRSDGWLRALAVGDYQLRIGQGLMAWSGFGLGKSIYPISVKRNSPTLAPYSSVDENRFFRGAAATLGKGSVELTVFGSYNKVDANLVQINDTALSEIAEEDVVTISSLQLTGLHRTDAELLDKDAIGFISAGGQIAYLGERFSISAASILYQFDAVLQETRSPYELYDFEGSRLINAGISYSYIWRNLLLFGETAMSDNGKIGTLNGLIIPIDKHVDLALVQRYFDPGYQTFFSQSFSENAYPRNEKGYYAGIEITPSRAWKVSGYIDLYESPWLEFSTDAPGYGVDYLSTITYKPSRNLETYLRFRHEISDRNAAPEFQGDTPHDLLTDEAKTRIRWNITYKVTREITLRNRIEYSRYDQQFDAPEQGFMLYQDAVYKPWERSFSLAGRYTVFQTDTYNTRIYAYENDLLYAYSIANMSGTGQRYYLLFQYSPMAWMDTWVKLVRTSFWGQTQIGTGNEAITGTNRTELRLQVRLKW